jgi:hypothetical protein
MSDSLLLPAQSASAAAPFLFSEFQGHAEERLNTLGEFSGDRLFAQRPEIYRAVVSMLAEGIVTTTIAKACQVSPNTIYAVRDREGVTIESERKELLKNLRQAAKLSVEKTLDLLPSLKSAKDAAITAAVMIDKLQLLSGEATSRIERVEVDGDAIMRIVQGAEVIDGYITGPLEGEPGQKALGFGVDLAGLGGADRGSVDIESTVSACSSIVRAETVAGLVATSENRGGSRSDSLTGGEGVEFSDHPPQPPTDLGEEKILFNGSVSGDDERPFDGPLT